MGIAITIPNGNYSTSFGQIVTELVDQPVTSVKISCNDYYIGTQYILSCQYQPLQTNQRLVRWEIVSGGSYAAIDSSSGQLTIFESANNTPVTIKATSAYDEGIYDIKEVVLTYKRSIVPQKMVRSLGALSNVDGDSDQILPGNVILVKKANTDVWVQTSAPPTIVTNKTEDEVLAMIEDGSIDDNTLYFCEE